MGWAVRDKVRCEQEWSRAVINEIICYSLRIFLQCIREYQETPNVKGYHLHKYTHTTHTYTHIWKWSGLYKIYKIDSLIWFFFPSVCKISIISKTDHVIYFLKYVSCSSSMRIYVCTHLPTYLIYFVFLHKCCLIAERTHVICPFGIALFHWAFCCNWCNFILFNERV